MTAGPDRDSDLIRKLGELPPLAPPADLAARIIRDVTLLPQQAAGEAAQPETPVAPLPRRARATRWLPRLVGGAVAASTIGALLVHVVPLADRADQAPPPAERPAQPVKVVTGAVEVRLATASEAAVAPPPVATPPARKAPRMVRRQTEQAPPPADTAPPEDMPVAVEPTAEFASESTPPVVQPAAPVRERAMVGPADPRGVMGPMPHSGPAPGFGISGSGGSMPVHPLHP